jgi:hypothetical protein
VVTLSVYFMAARLPNRDEWEAESQRRGVPVRFVGEFEPGTHPICQPIR